MDYYNYFKKYGLDANSEKKKFMFVHLNGTHDPSPEMSMLYPGYTEGMPVDLESTTMGVFTMLGQYFDEMKKLGVFDNSTIIIIADHGCPPYEYNVYHQDRMEKARLTTLLIKPENSPALPLAVDADSELSNGNFAASVLEYAGIDTEEYGNSYNDIIKNDLHWDRYMQTHDVKENIIKKALYVVRGSARDFDNWYVESE